MKDRQVASDSPSGEIPFLSPLLHCIAMSGLVFLRSSFGYLYLRPKAIFLSFGYASVLFAIYAWNEPVVWSRYGIASVFAASAAALYTLHLTIAFTSQLRRKAKHDKFSGASHLSFLARPLFRRDRRDAEMFTHLWLEPAVLLAVAAVLRFRLSEVYLSAWLAAASGALLLKEFLNVWNEIRVEKRRSDSFEDAEEALDDPTPASPPPTRDENAAGRKKGTKRPRATDNASTAETEAIHAEALELRRPYTLDEAEGNYRRLVKEFHPDTHDGSAGSIEQTTKINAAIEYFREKFSSS